MSLATRARLSPERVKALWGEIKAQERQEKAEARRRDGLPEPGPQGALAGVPLPLPALTRALKLQEKAGKVGFDWNDPLAVLAKLREELLEIEAELAAGAHDKVAAEVGDLLFAAANLARHLNVDPEAALRGTNAKFERRFAHIEARLAEGGRKPERCKPRRDGRPLGRSQSSGAAGRPFSMKWRRKRPSYSMSSNVQWLFQRTSISSCTF